MMDSPIYAAVQMGFDVMWENRSENEIAQTL